MKLLDYFKKKKLNQLEADIKMLANKINFDARYALNRKVNLASDFTLRTEEYKIWAMGDATILRDAYRDADIGRNLNYFWKKCPTTSMMKHCGIPSLISQKMATILFGAGINVDVNIFNENGEKDEKKSQSSKELLLSLVDILKLQEKFQSGAVIESWGGHVFYKISIDTTLTSYPIVEVYDITKARSIKKRGITTAIVFSEWFEENKKEYRLDEIYTTNTEGDALIQYELILLDKNNEEKVVPLSSTKKTVDYAEQPIFVFSGIKGMLAFEKPNKMPSLLFPESPYGASDYEGAIDSFDAMDEAYTNIFKELRTNRTIRYIPKDMIPTDNNGNSILGDDFTDAYVQVTGDPDQNNDSKIEIVQVIDKTDEHKAKFLTALTTALNKAGLSPFAIGVTGMESINASAESQQERNKVTLETRAAKHEKWKPFIEDMLMRIVSINSWMLKNTNARQDAFDELDLNYENTTIRVSFGDYTVEPTEKKVTNWAAAKTSGIASTKEAVSNLHSDWTDEQVDEEVNIIHYEQGIDASNPAALPNLEGVVTNEDTE